MKLNVLKVSVPVLMLMMFQTGNCGIAGRFARKVTEMSNMTPMQKVEARRNFWAEVEGRPVVRPMSQQLAEQSASHSNDENQSTDTVLDVNIEKPKIYQIFGYF